MRRNKDLHKGTSEFKEALRETARAQSELGGLQKKISDIGSTLESTVKIHENRLNTIEEVIRNAPNDTSGDASWKEIEERMMKNYESLRTDLEELRELVEVEFESRDKNCSDRCNDVVKKIDVELDGFEEYVKSEMDKFIVEFKEDLQGPIELKHDIEQMKADIKELKSGNRGRPREATDTEPEHKLPPKRSLSAGRMKNMDQLGTKV